MKVLYERVAGIGVHKNMTVPRGALLYPGLSREEFGGISGSDGLPGAERQRR